MMAVVISVLGILSTVLVWFFNPRNAIYRELDSIYKQLEINYAKRDKALVENDSDTLTVVTADIIKLCERKNSLLQRFK